MPREKPTAIRLDLPTLAAMCPSDARILVVHHSDRWLGRVWERRNWPPLVTDHRTELRIESVWRRTLAAILWNQERKPGPVEFLGAFVAPRMRRRGLAKALIREMMRRSHTRTVCYSVATPDGAALIQSLQRTYPGVAWHVHPG